jgi:hypothetical protein
MPIHPLQTDQSLPRRLAHAFAPVHKSALGIAVGLTFGLLLFAITAFHIIVAAASRDVELLGLLAQYFYGYSVTWQGAAVGLLWGFFTGYVTGWFAAFVRNLFLAVWLLLVRAKAHLNEPFLDHI